VCAYNDIFLLLLLLLLLLLSLPSLTSVGSLYCYVDEIPEALGTDNWNPSIEVKVHETFLTRSKFKHTSEERQL